ncbi:MAG: NosD domain-containing protein [Thermoplasmata archaeon]
MTTGMRKRSFLLWLLIILLLVAPHIYRPVHTLESKHSSPACYNNQSCFGNSLHYTSQSGFRLNIHETINITGNDSFNSSNGVVRGSGTEADPYIIEGWYIDAEGGSYCIQIKNTNAFFIIRNCTLLNAIFGTRYQDVAGIVLSNVTNGTMDNLSLSNNRNGLILSSSSNCTISNTSITNNTQGIRVVSSANNTILGNNFTNNTYGIFLNYANNNRLLNNTISNSTVSIYHSYSTSTTLSGNNLQGSGILFDGNNITTWNTHEIDTTNLVNGKPVYYYKNQEGVSVPSDAVQVILANCTNMAIANIISSNAIRAVQLGFSQYNTIVNITVSGQQDAIFLASSENNIIENNTLLNNGNGTNLTSSHRNQIRNNTISSNSNYGIRLFLSDSNSIAGNRLFNNTICGILLSASCETFISNNSFCNNGILVEGNSLTYWNTHEIDTSNYINNRSIYYYKNQNGVIVPSDAGQVILANCTNITVANLNITNTTYCAIQIAFSNNNTIMNNTVSRQQYAFYLIYSDYNMIMNNTASNNSYGIYLFWCNYTHLNFNNLFNNFNFSLYLSSSCNNTISSNNASRNFKYGIY